MNKLKDVLFNKKDWGNELILVVTDGYILKTIEMPPSVRSNVVVHEQKEKTIVVVSGDLYLTYGICCDAKKAPVYKLKEGYYWHIDSGNVYAYQTLDKPARIIEISSPEIDDGIVLLDKNGDGPTTSIEKIKKLSKQLDKKTNTTKKKRKGKSTKNDKT